MEVLSATAGKIAELTVIPIGRQVEYVIFYKQNMKELNENFEELKTRNVRIEHEIEAERKNGRGIEADVVKWQNDFKETLEKVEKLYKDEPHASVQCWKWSFPNLKSRHQLGRKAKKMAVTIAKLMEKGTFDGGVGHVLASSNANLIFATRGSEKLESRNSLKKEIRLSLTDPKVRKVGIYGLPGVGKTTLAKEVAHHVKDDKLFDVVAMTTISQTLDVERVQDEIAYQLGFHFDEITSIGRADQLCARIKMEKNILIILDDLWEKVDLDKLGIPPEQDDLKGGKLSLTSKCLDVSQKNETYQGCKLLLTSRNSSILEKNETQKNISLNQVNDAESWGLFEDMIGDAIKNADLKQIATQIVKKCAGLPVMIVSIAKSLKYNKNIHYWKDVLDNLKRVDNTDVHGTVFPAFEFTYERLKDDEMKKVFLLCGVYGPSMSVSDLLKCVIGLSILKHKSTVEVARNRLYSIIQELKASCLLLDDDGSEVDVIKMHDLVREVALSIAYKREHVFVLKGNDKKQDWLCKGFHEWFTQIILKPCCLQELPSKLDCPNLKFFLLQCTDNCTLKIPDSFFEGMRSLEALDLRGLVISSLPQSLVSLSKLKTLCLDQCTLKHLTGIGALKNLEILSFLDSSMEEFPSEIEQLAHLKMLDLSNSGIEIMPPDILSKLTKIEELYMGNTSIKWEEESSAIQNMKSKSLIELGGLTSLTTLEIHIREAWILSMDMMFDRLERYKVVIGDKWEWSSNKRTSRLLKLKLGTSIHLEPGIKALIKRAEDLYLDEVDGISDVLLDLKGEGFPQLKFLHIQNNGQVQCIINTTERDDTHALFPELETLVLHNLNNLEKICHGPLPVDCFRKLTIIKVKECDKLVYLLPILMVKALSQLVEIQVSKCSSMEMILYIENVDGSITTDEKIEFNSLRSLSIGHLPVIRDLCSNEFTSCMTTTSLFNDIKVSFSSLETLKLSSVNLEKIWDDDDLCAANCIHNLANFIVEDCGSLKHLFSPSVVGSLSKLKHLEISKCEMMEEIIAPKEINNNKLEEVRPSKLETMVIKDMKSLKKVWHFQFEGLKSLEVSNCGKLVNIFPSDMQGKFGNLETLKVNDCDSVEEIFQLTAEEIHSEDETITQVSQLKKLHLLVLPKLKQIWSRDADQANLCFRNLQLVYVESCENLEYLFPFSIAMQAIELEDVTIKYARSMKRIVSDKEGPTDSSVKFEFNHLTSLVLWRLYELEGLFARNHRVICPLLRKLDIRKCLKLKLFKAQSSSSRERVFDSEVQISIEQPLFTLEEVICNLEMLALHREDASMILQGKFLGKHFSKLKHLFLSGFEGDHATFPCWFLQNITTLTSLLVEWSSFREIFQEEIHIDAKGKFKTGTRIKTLTLYQLQDLQHICKEGFQVDPILEDIEYLYVGQCSNLKHLVPSSVTFSHLTYLEVRNCNGLIYLLTSSTARSLVKLTTMKIGYCNSLEIVVVEEKEGSKDEIAFSSLEILQLECLRKIKKFCSCDCFLNLPLLKEVVVNKCPRMDSFSGKDTSTPKLQKISTKEDGEVYWEGDINKTLKKLFADMVMFSTFNHLEFSEYPELKEIWYSQVGQKIFCNLKHLVVRKCTFLSNTLFSPILLQLLYTLEELEVTECDSLEAVFDVKALNDATMESKGVSGLKKLTLLRLPNLKHIWNKEAGEIISFGNLQIVKVDECPNLKYVFSSSLCHDLRQLEELNIESCGVEKIVANEGLEELKFHFPLLRILWLINLRQLNDFYLKRYTLECPLLKELNVSRCGSLQIFAFEHLDSYQLKGGCGDLPIQQALFHIEKVPENLEEISLTETDAMKILNGNYEKKLFQRTKLLHLQYFQETPIKFLNGFIQKFPATTTLQARCSYFKTLFPSEEIGHCSIQCPPQIKTLWLFLLDKLEHIWNDTSALDTFVPNLEHLGIYECCRLIRLAPSLTSFTNLITLEVEDCNGLMDFMSPFTAKSLIHLTSLAITNCKMLEEVVMTDEGGPEEEIIFKSLKDLELTCLPRFKSFCFGKHTFIFPSLVTLKVTGCHKMQNFSSGITVAPFLKLIEVENGKKRWKGDLNTTINHLFLDKTNENLNMDTIEASSSKEQVGESKPNQIADTGKQDTQKKEPSSGSERPLTQVTQNASSPSTNQEAERIRLARGTQEMGENIERPSIEAVEVTGVYDTAIGIQEIHDTIDKPLIQTDQDAEQLATTQNAEESWDLHIETQNICDTINRPPIPTAQDAPNSNMFREAEESQGSSIGIQEMCETIKKPSISIAQNDPSSSSNEIPDAATTYPSPSQAPELDTAQSIGLTKGTQEMGEHIERPMVEAAEIAPRSTRVYNAEGSHESETCPRENLFNQPKILATCDNNEAVGSQEIRETMDEPLIQTDRHAQKLATSENTEKSRGDSCIESQKMGDTIKKPSSPTEQNVPNSTMIPNIAAIDPSPSKSTQPMMASAILESNAYNDDKWLNYIPKQNLPYLEFGMKRHPQVLNWFNTKRRGVFTAIFTEVTRILRTTRRCDLTEDDQNHIRECCAALEAVGFDASWLNYVYGCIESCVNGDELIRKLEETEAKASTLRNELASVEASLATMRDKASRLHNFIES